MIKLTTKREDEIKVISTNAVMDFDLGFTILDVKIKWMDKTFSFQKEFDPETCEIDDELDDVGFDKLCSFVDEYAEESDEFDSDAFFENLNKRVVIHHKATAFEAELKKIGITQSEFCERIGMTRQTVIGWKRAGKYPEWLKYALKGMPLVIEDEKTVTINGSDYIYIDSPLLITEGGVSISILKSVYDKTYIIAKTDHNLKPEVDDFKHTRKKSFNSLDECHEFISQIADGRPYDDFFIHKEIDSLLN